MSKVILLAPTPPPAGGIAGWTVRMMNAQLKNGWQVEVVDEKFTDDRQVFGDKSNRNLFAETKRCFRIWRDLGRALKDPDALVVHSCIPSMTPSMLREYICACITKSQKRKFIIHFRCTVPNTTKTRLGKYVLKKLCDKSDMIITLNAQTNEYLEKITKTPMKLIPNFVSESELAQTHIIREKIEKVLCVGGVVESKGAYEVLELAQRFPDIEFRFVGHADSSVLGYAREQNISNAVFTGQKSREAVKEELADADVFVHLTHYFGEGFSNAILEAMAAGLPCIVTDWASNKEMIGDKNMVVNVGDVDAAANLLRVLNSPEERRKQSELNIQKIKAEYLDVHVPNQYVDAYEACIGKYAKRVLLINSVCGIRSTGRICTDIAAEFEKSGYDVKIAYGREMVPEQFAKYAVKICSAFDNKIAALHTRITDKHGFANKLATKRFLRWAEKYNPDLLWLHNIHGYYINVEMLFKWIKSRPDMQVKWTLHDCWAFTGHCTHFTAVNCDKWKTHCEGCVQMDQYPITKIRDGSAENFDRKRDAFTGVKRLSLITPSNWLADRVKQSFLSGYPVEVVNNTINTSIFKPTPSDFRQRNNIQDKKIILGVSSIWNERKGFFDFLKLAKMIDDEYRIVLVGVDEKQIKLLPNNVIGIKRTNSPRELAEIYTAADVFVNPSVEETFGLTTVEAMACGAPVIVYRDTACEEIVQDYLESGKAFAVNMGDVQAIHRKICTVVIGE